MTPDLQTIAVDATARVVGLSRYDQIYKIILAALTEVEMMRRGDLKTQGDFLRAAFEGELSVLRTTNTALQREVAELRKAVESFNEFLCVSCEECVCGSIQSEHGCPECSRWERMQGIVSRVLKRPSPMTTTAAEPESASVRQVHNPDKLTDEQIGVSDGWRLLDEDEIDSNHPKEARQHECWDVELKKWRGLCTADFKAFTYRTKLTRAELRSARGLPPEPTQSCTCTDKRGSSSTCPIHGLSSNPVAPDVGTPTPDTDSEWDGYKAISNDPFQYSVVRKSFAQKLEQERDAAKSMNVLIGVELATAREQRATALAKLEAVTKERDALWEPEIQKYYERLEAEFGRVLFRLNIKRDGGIGAEVAAQELMLSRDSIAYRLETADARCAIMRQAIEAKINGLDALTYCEESPALSEYMRGLAEAFQPYAGAAMLAELKAAREDVRRWVVAWASYRETEPDEPARGECFGKMEECYRASTAAANTEGAK